MRIQQRSALHLAIWLALLAVSSTGCGRSPDKNARIEPVYDPKTGRLQLLKYDANNNGTIDTWSYMDGARVLRIEIDADEDGKLDRWEYYALDQKLERVGFSRLSDGREDAWSYFGPEGKITRIDISGNRDGKITRTEHLEGEQLVAAEEDTDGDGRMDKWERYDSGRLTSVAFDTIRRGTADRRLMYAPDGSARIETDLDGDGHFTAEK